MEKSVNVALYQSELFTFSVVSCFDDVPPIAGRGNSQGCSAAFVITAKWSSPNRYESCNYKFKAQIVGKFNFFNFLIIPGAAGSDIKSSWSDCSTSSCAIRWRLYLDGSGSDLTTLEWTTFYDFFDTLTTSLFRVLSNQLWQRGHKLIDITQTVSAVGTTETDFFLFVSDTQEDGRSKLNCPAIVR